MRTRYCTEADKQHERYIGALIGETLPEGYAIFANADIHGLDLFILDPDGEVYAEIEVKKRGHSYGDHPDLTLSTKKIDKIRKCDGRGFLFITYKNGTYWAEITEKQYESRMGGRTRDQRDQWDREMMDHIPVSEFTNLEEAAPLWD